MQKFLFGLTFPRTFPTFSTELAGFSTGNNEFLGFYRILWKTQADSQREDYFADQDHGRFILIDKTLIASLAARFVSASLADRQD